MISVQALQYFMKVYEKRSLNKAAAELFVSQPALSLAMKNLEQDLHMTLMERSNRGIVITQDGEELYQHCEILMKQLMQIEHLGQRKSEERLCVSAFPDLCPPEAAGRLLQEEKYRNLRIDFEVCRTYQALQNVENGISEIAIVQYNTRQEKTIRKQFEQMDLLFIPEMVHTLAAAVGENSPLYTRKEVTFKELQKYRHIRYQDDLYSYITGEMKEKEIRMDNLPRCYINSSELTRYLLQTTDMYTFSSVENHAMERRYNVRMIPVAQANTVVTIGWVRQKKHEPGQAAKRFLELWKEELQRV